MHLKALLLLLPLAGCTAYRPLGPAEPAPGTHVRATLTDAGAVQLAQYLGPRVEAVRGSVRFATPDSFGLAVAAIQLRNGMENFWEGEPVTLPQDAVARLEERRLSKGRTALLAGGLLATIIAVSSAFMKSGGPDVVGPPEPPPTGK